MDIVRPVSTAQRTVPARRFREILDVEVDAGFRRLSDFELFEARRRERLRDEEDDQVDDITGTEPLPEQLAPIETRTFVDAKRAERAPAPASPAPAYSSPLRPQNPIYSLLV